MSLLMRFGTASSRPFRWFRNAMLPDHTRGIGIITKRTLVGLVGVAYYYNCCSTSNVSLRAYSICESFKDTTEDTSDASNEAPSVSLVIKDDQSGALWWWNGLLSSLYRTVRILARCLQLTFTFTPMIALYPFYHCLLLCRPADPAGSSTDAQDIAVGLQYQNCGELNGMTRRSSLAHTLIQWYYQLCLFSVEQSGATIVKFMQWVSTRPDLFGYSFCLIFSKLQDHTTPHARRHTERMLKDAYGPDWSDTIELGPVIGSGCIGQVYHGAVVVRNNDENSSDTSDQRMYQQVAIKVLHPHVRQSIDTDLDILRCIVRVLPYVPFTNNIYEQWKWLNLNGIVEEFALLLKMQMDLRNEAQHLEKFNQNFAKDQVIQFPQLIQHVQPTSNVLMETFCEGTSYICGMNLADCGIRSSSSMTTHDLVGVHS
jgi:ABC1 atypical kinase-like domain